MRTPELRGIVAATVLPMTANYEIDAPALRDYVAWLLEQGVHGLAVNVACIALVSWRDSARAGQEDGQFLATAAQQAGSTEPAAKG